MKKLVLFGAGDIARLAHFYFSRDTEHEVAAFVVDAAYRQDETFLGLPLTDAEEVVERYPPDDFRMFVALSYARMNKVRAEKYLQAKDQGYELATYVSPRATLLSDQPIGENCFILEDNTIQPMARIGNNVTMWSGNHVGHDVTVEDHCFITSHVVISGFVHVGRSSFLGVNATLRNSITIAPETLIGAGAIIMADTEEKGVYVPRRTEKIHKTSDEIKL